MHVACSLAATRRLLPALTRLRAAIEVKADVWSNLVKIGRTHLQDATPLTLGQEFSGYANQLYRAGRRIEPAIVNGTNRLAQGGTAVGTEIGRANVGTPVTNAHLVCRLLLEKKN